MRDDFQKRTAAIDTDYLLLVASTGIGKTKTALMAAKGTLLVVCYRLVHMENFKQEVRKWQYPHQVKYVTYRSLHKHRGLKYGTVLIDEAHHLCKDHVDIIKSITKDKLIGLSATIEHLPDKLALALQLGKPTIVKVTLQDAIDAGYLPKPDIRVKFLNFRKGERDMEYAWGKNRKKKTYRISYDEWIHKYKYSSPKPNFRIKCNEHEYNLLIEEHFAYWGFIGERAKEENKWKLYETVGKQFIALGGERQKFFYTVKEPIIKNELKNTKERCIVFAGSIEQADRLAIAEGYSAVHSKNKQSQRMINLFNSGKIGRLYSVDMLVEGMNLANLKKSFIIRMPKGLGRILQMFGRSFRDDKPIINLFVYKDSDEMNILRKIQGQLKKEYFTYE